MFENLSICFLDRDSTCLETSQCGRKKDRNKRRRLPDQAVSVLCEVRILARVRTLREFLVLVELDPIQGALELLSGVEAGQDAADQLAADFFGSLCAFAGGPQPEAAEIAQFYNVALGKLAWDNGKEALDGCHHIDSGQRGHLCRPFCQLARRHAPAGLDGGIEFLGSFTVGWVTPLYDIKFYRHSFTGLLISFFHPEGHRYPSESLQKQNVPCQSDKARHTQTLCAFTASGNRVLVRDTGVASGMLRKI